LLPQGSAGPRHDPRREPARDHLDAFFGPAYTIPLFQKIPTVVAIHDVSFVAHPEWFTTREGLRRRVMTRRSARRAQNVITISEFSRRELVERLGVRESVLHVIPPGIWPPPAETTPIARGGEHNVLFVGSIFNRRHVPDLIRAFGTIARRHADAGLEIVGDNRSYPRQDLARTIAAEALNGRVGWSDYVDNERLASLYAASRAFAFLSEYEGLGLTPLEALAAGVPPLLLDTPVARESCGDAALYVPSSDIREIADALEQLLYDEATRSSILAAAAQTLARYDWQRAARDTLAVIEASA
jgi:glycosyltransferase involved in cell wall biosynthesis